MYCTLPPPLPAPVKTSLFHTLESSQIVTIKFQPLYIRFNPSNFKVETFILSNLQWLFQIEAREINTFN